MSTHAVHGGDFFLEIGESFQTLERIENVVSADVLDSWYDPSPMAVAKLRQHLPWLMRTSPPTYGEGLREVVARVRGVAPESVLLGSGTSSLMYLAFPRLIGPTSRVLMLEPTYSEYPHLISHVVGAEVQTHELWPSTDFRPDVARLCEQARDADMVILVNPNSPSGMAITPNDIRAILQSMHSTALLWVDETYIGYLPAGSSVETLVAEDGRLIVAKSMSKFYGLSGLRLGYLVASPRLVTDLEPLVAPWSVGLIAQVAGVEALLDGNYYERMSWQTAHLRADLALGLDGICGLKPYPSNTNFILFETADLPSAELVRRARAKGVFLRDCSSMSPRLTGKFVRTSVKDAIQNEHILSALRLSVLDDLIE